MAFTATPGSADAQLANFILGLDAVQGAAPGDMADDTVTATGSFVLGDVIAETVTATGTFAVPFLGELGDTGEVLVCFGRFTCDTGDLADSRYRR